MERKLTAFKRLLEIMDDLRAECPWDKKQTIESLRYLTLEETYELSDAIIKKDMSGIKEELGDLMLHLVFYSKIASEKNQFDIADVLNTICDKLVRRHPHIYSDVVVKDEEDVKNNWEKIKLGEKGHESVLSGVPESMPPLVKAVRIQEKARDAGFDWEKTSQVWDKVVEEKEELLKEVKENSGKKEDEFGDLMFALINYARFIDVNPEDALEKSNRKFIKRFHYIEEKAKSMNKSLRDMTLAEMDALWNEAKKTE